MMVMREDMKMAAGNLHLCYGHHANGEEIFQRQKIVTTLVNAINAFNSVNKKEMLHTAAIKSPEICRYVKDCFGMKLPSELFIVAYLEKEMIKKINLIF